MKLPHPLSGRATPRMPVLDGYPACFDAVPGIAGHAQPAEAVRPVYWWVRELRRRGDVLVDLRFDTNPLAARVTVQLASYRVSSVVVAHGDKPMAPHDLPSLIAHGVWRLGVLQWAEELRMLTDLLVGQSLMTSLAPVERCTREIPGLVDQPEDAVRIAYWWAKALTDVGWKLEEYGRDVAHAGFVAEIPVDGGTELVIYPCRMRDDGTEASALANFLGSTLVFRPQRQLLAKLVAGSAAAEQGGAS